MADYQAAQKHFAKFSIDDVVIRDNKCIFVTLMERAYIHKQENSLDYEVHLASWYPEGTVWKSVSFSNLYKPKGCFEHRGNEKKFIAIDMYGTVISQTKNDPADFIMEDFKLPGPISHVRSIAGKIYVASGYRHVHRRIDVNQWEKIHGYSPEEIKTLKKQGVNDMGFRDIDGYNESNIYACGDSGDLWHYNGESWRMLDCPTNEDLTCLHLANDGWIYIGTNRGKVLKGRNHNWEVLSGQTNLHEPINDIIWFKDRLYIAAGGLSGIYTIIDDKVLPLDDISANLNQSSEETSKRVEEVLKLAGGDKATLDKLNLPQVDISISGAHTLSTDGEYLLIACNEEVISFNGQKWSIFYSSLPPHGSGKGGSLE